MLFNLYYLNKKLRFITFFAASVILSWSFSVNVQASTSNQNSLKKTDKIIQNQIGSSSFSPPLNTAKTRNIIVSSAVNAQISPATIDLVKHYEGFRAYAYIDTSGLPVIGYGQTKIHGKTVRMGQYVTKAQADAALARELDHIQRLVKANVKVKLTSNQLGALTSLVYNSGTRVIKSSTLSRKLNAGDYAGAAREFTRWNKANQRGRLVPMPGLTKRRLAEQKLFLTP